jgi:hypothetical protein
MSNAQVTPISVTTHDRISIRAERLPVAEPHGPRAMATAVLGWLLGIATGLVSAHHARRQV